MSAALPGAGSAVRAPPGRGKRPSDSRPQDGAGQDVGRVVGSGPDPGEPDAGGEQAERDGGLRRLPRGAHREGRGRGSVPGRKGRGHGYSADPAYGWDALERRPGPADGQLGDPVGGGAGDGERDGRPRGRASSPGSGQYGGDAEPEQAVIRGPAQ